MLTVSKLGNATASSKYFATADYYTKGEQNVDIESNWYGKGALALGLKGEIDPEMLESVLKGQLPNGVQLGKKEKGELKHASGWDLIFSAPKSVSLLSVLGGDKDLLNAHHEAVKETLDYLEQHLLKTQTTTEAQERVFINAPNMVVGQYTHTTSRAQDPQLHTHNLVMNAVMTEDGQWRSAWSKDMYLNKMLMGVIYRAKLAELSKDLGYNPIWNAKDGTFELAEIDKNQLAEFSKRQQEIEAYAKDHGLESQKDLDLAADATRAKKMDVPTNELFSDWESRAKSIDLDLSKIIDGAKQQRNERINEETKTTGAEKASADNGTAPEAKPSNSTSTTQNNNNQAETNEVDSRRQTSTNRHDDGQKNSERSLVDSEHEKPNMAGADSNRVKPNIDPNSVRAINAYEKVKLAVAIQEHYEHAFSLESVREQALKMSNGEYSIAHVEMAIYQLHSEDQLIPSQKQSNLVTTPGAIKRELGLLDEVIKGQNSFTPIGNDKQIDKVVQNAGFTEGQEKTFVDALSTKDKFFAVQGFAGVGKTYMALPVAQIAKMNGYNVSGMAPNGTQAKVLGNELGVQSNTVKAFIMQHESQAPTADKNLWIVDEAAMLNAKDMEQIVKLASERKNTRMLLMGDGKQLGSIEAGRAMMTMIRGGMSHSINTDILRQKSNQDYKDVVTDLSLGKIDTAFNKMKPFSHSIEDTEKRFDAFAAEYMEYYDKHGKMPLAVIPSKEGEAKFSGIVREALRERGVLGKDDITVNTLASAKVDGPMKSYTEFYSEGMTLRFNRKFKDTPTSKGDYFKVARIEGVFLHMEQRNEEGKLISSFRFNPAEYKMKESDLIAYETKPRKFSTGDKIIWKDTDRANGILNGTQGKILDINKNSMTIDFGENGQRTFDMKNERSQHFQHDYSSTVPSVQGSTSNHNMMMAESWRRNLVRQASMLVGVSRGKDSLSVYTDDYTKLHEEVRMRTSEKAEGVEHVTMQQAQSLREPEKSNPGFFRSIGIKVGIAKEQEHKPLEHPSVHFGSMETIREKQPSTQPSRAAVPKPQHEKSR